MPLIPVAAFIFTYVQKYCATFSALTLLVVRQEGHPACKKTEQRGAGMVICLERGADLHMAQLMPLQLNVSCFSKIQIGFTFLVPAHPGSPGQRAVKRVCVCVCVCVRACVRACVRMCVCSEIFFWSSYGGDRPYPWTRHWSWAQLASAEAEPAALARWTRRNRMQYDAAAELRTTTQ